jgi:transposase
MQVVYERCGGLEVHTRTVVACVLVAHPEGTVQRDVRTFGTMTADVLALSDWLTGRGIQVLARESTGVYGRPADTLLEEGRQILRVNPQHLKTVPGRKTDVKDAEDAEWRADPARATACSRPASSRPNRCATCVK